MADSNEQFQSLIKSLTTLAADRDAAASKLAALDKQLTSLSSAIALTSSAFNVPSGLLCMLRPITLSSHALSSPDAQLLLELSLLNESPLGLSEGNWTLIAAHLTPDSTSLVHVAPLPAVPAGSSWKAAFSISPGLSSTDSTSLAVLLCFNLDTSALDYITEPSVPSIALLHVFQLDNLHWMQGCNGSGAAANTRAARKGQFSGYNTNSKPVPSVSTQMGVKLGLQKAVFGLNPDLESVLNALLQQGQRSVPEPVNAVDPFLDQPSASLAAVFSSGVSLVHREQKYVALKGSVPANNGSTEAMEINFSKAGTTANSAASPYAERNLHIKAESLVGCLKLHEAALQRVQLLQNAVQRGRSGGTSGSLGDGVLLPNGVLIPSSCSFSADLDENELDSVSGKLHGLREAAMSLREAVRDAENQDNGSKYRDFQELVVQTRDITGKLSINL